MSNPFPRILAAEGAAARLPILLLLAASLGFPACAVRPKTSPLPSVTFEEPGAGQATTARKRAAVEHLESHVFPLTNADSVIGTLATIDLREGDTLSDVARHFGLGYEEIVAANPSQDPWVIANGTVAWVPVTFVLPKAARRGIVINLAAMRLFHYPASKSGAEVVTYPVGIGREGRSTPTGAMAIAQKRKDPTWRPTANILNDHLKRGDPLPAVVPPGPDNPLGAYAMYLTAPRYLIHGTNKPYSIGLRASNGCIRLYPENVERLFPSVAVREPVTIVNQPYLVGSREGVTYLQAYQPHEEVNAAAAKQRVRSELKTLETESGQHFDWTKIDQILSESRGIPYPVSAATPPLDQVMSSAVQLARPAHFYGQPQLPPEDPSGWHVIAAETASELSARRMAGIMNHQGPPIPARVIDTGERYRVVAGPFPDPKTAQKTAKRLQVDLELDSTVLAPDTALAGVALPASRSPEPAVPVTTEPEPSAPAWSEPEPMMPAAPEPVVPAAAQQPDEPTPAAAPEPGAPYDDWPTRPEPPESPRPVDAPFEEAAPVLQSPEQSWPESPVPKDTTASEPAPTAEPVDSSTPSSTPEPLPETTERTEPLDLSLPDQFSDPTAPPAATDRSLELPPDVGPEVPRSAKTPRQPDTDR